MNLGKITAAIAAAALMVAVGASDGSAARKVLGKKYFDYSSNTWKVWSGAGGRVRSDVSPIRKKTVRFAGKQPKGTIIIDTSERRLYYVLGNGKAYKYGVGVGRQGFTWTGTNRISRKAEWPSWSPPAVMIRREARKGRKLKSYYAGGPNNPLGARAMYLGSTIYRIHGTSEPWTIGQAVSSGCIRMSNNDVRELYKLAGVGTKVIVRQ